MSVSVTCELRSLSRVLSDVDSEFLNRKGEQLRAMQDALWSFTNVIYLLTGPDYHRDGFVSLAESLKPVEEAQAVALEGWDVYGGVFPWTMERKLSLHGLYRYVEEADREIAEGRSPWAGRSATSLLAQCDVLEARIGGAKSIVAVLLGMYV